MSGKTLVAPPVHGYAVGVAQQSRITEIGDLAMQMLYACLGDTQKALYRLGIIPQLVRRQHLYRIGFARIDAIVLETPLPGRDDRGLDLLLIFAPVSGNTGKYPLDMPADFLFRHSSHLMNNH